MNNKQKTVLWLGLMLVVLNLIVQWSKVKSVIFSGGSKSSNSSGSSGGGGPSIPFLPPNPFFPIPLSQTQPTPPKVQVT